MKKVLFVIVFMIGLISLNSPVLADESNSQNDESAYLEEYNDVVLLEDVINQELEAKGLDTLTQDEADDLYRVTCWKVGPIQMGNTACALRCVAKGKTGGRCINQTCFCYSN